MEKSIKVFAPATVANLTCGFDLLGLAIEKPGDEVIVKLNNNFSGIRISKITGDNGKLPLDPTKNTATGAMISLLAKHNLANENYGIEVEIHKKMPFGSGMGSSAASAAAASVALNELLELKLSQHDLISFAMDGEKLASGSLHADNVAPAILGGITLTRGYTPLDVVSIPYRNDLYCSVVYPEIEIKTLDARQLLPQQIERSKWTTSLGNLAGMITGLTTQNNDILARSMTDEIIEPLRGKLIPGFENIKHAAIQTGALAVGISGSGPSIFTFSDNEDTANKVSDNIEKEFKQLNINSHKFVSLINPHGAVII